jgi:hypothetical protein
MVTALNLIAAGKKHHTVDCDQRSYGESKMLTKIALATALVVGTAGVVLASPDADSNGGFRQLGPGGVVTDGVNPAYHPSMRNAARNAYGYAPAPVTKQTTTTK